MHYQHSRTSKRRYFSRFYDTEKEMSSEKDVFCEVLIVKLFRVRNHQSVNFRVRNHQSVNQCGTNREDVSQPFRIVAAIPKWSS